MNTYENMFHQQGWVCPGCNRVYSPTTPVCFYCPTKTTTDTKTTTGSPMLPKREWAGLTDEDLRQIILATIGISEAKLKEKNT